MSKWKIFKCPERARRVEGQTTFSIKNMQDNKTEIILLKDSQWSVIDGEPCRVVRFTPLVGWVEDGKVMSADNRTPHASVAIECKKFPHEVTGFITNKLDFANLWSAFKEKGVRADEEVIIIWSKKHLKSYARILSPFMPKLRVMICIKRAFDLMTNPEFRPELSSGAREVATAPIMEWKPEVMK